MTTRVPTRRRRRRRRDEDDPPRALGYTIVPRDEAVAERHADRIRAACTRLDLDLVEVLGDRQPDHDTPAERPGLSYVLDRLVTHEASCLVVSDLEDLSPEVEGLDAILDQLDAASVRLIALDVALDTETHTGRLALVRTEPPPEPLPESDEELEPAARVAVPAFEHARLAGDDDERREELETRRAKRRARQIESGGPEWDGVRRRIATMRADGMSLQAIVDTLNSEGVLRQLPGIQRQWSGPGGDRLGR